MNVEINAIFHENEMRKEAHDWISVLVIFENMSKLLSGFFWQNVNTLSKNKDKQIHYR